MLIAYKYSTYTPIEMSNNKINKGLLTTIKNTISRHKPLVLGLNRSLNGNQKTKSDLGIKPTK